jgi:hypothetical protein
LTKERSEINHQWYIEHTPQLPKVSQHSSADKSAAGVKDVLRGRRATAGCFKGNKEGAAAAGTPVKMFEKIAISNSSWKCAKKKQNLWWRVTVTRWRMRKIYWSGKSLFPPLFVTMSSRGIWATFSGVVNKSRIYKQVEK